MKWIMTVGQMSKLFNITAETLRHYDRIGLLKPIVDEENGYRYYSIKEMEKLEIKAKRKIERLICAGNHSYSSIARILAMDGIEISPATVCFYAESMGIGD